MTEKAPDWLETCERTPMLLQAFVPFEYLTGWFFYLFNTSTLVRFSVEAAAAGAILLGVWGLFEEFKARDIERENQKEERLVRMWNLATDPRQGNSGKIPALEYLNKLKKPLIGISIPKAYLVGIDLSGANIDRADLSGAELSEANLSGTRLVRANLSGADLGQANLIKANLNWANLSWASLYWADLSGATLFNTDLSGTFLSEAKSLTQLQLGHACADQDNPPKLPKDENGNRFVWHGKPCPKK